MVKAVFYVPLRDRDGRSLRADVQSLRRKIYLRFFGWTYLGQVTGVYRMADGTRAIDKSSAYMVALEELQISELEELLLEFKRGTLQEAIYMEIYRNIDVRFL